MTEIRVIETETSEKFESLKNASAILFGVCAVTAIVTAVYVIWAGNFSLFTPLRQSFIQIVIQGSLSLTLLFVGIHMGLIEAGKLFRVKEPVKPEGGNGI